MKALEFIKNYIPTADKQNALNFLTEKEIKDEDIDQSIIDFIQKFKNDEISTADVEQFNQKLTEINNNVKDAIINVMFEIAQSVYKDFDKEVTETIELIDEGLRQGAIPQEEPNSDKYIRLINIYRLLASKDSILKKGVTSYIFPGVPAYKRDKLEIPIVFALNSLMLTGKISKEIYKKIDSGKTLYPLKLIVTQKEKLPIKKGIKDSKEYFPYKKVSKLDRGQTGDTTFLATNGSKSVFMRGVNKYYPEGILASKIANLVSFKDPSSPKYFSSERLMNNQIVASRGIDSYCPLSHQDMQDKINKDKAEKKFFSGIGIIDEVTNFIWETDRNIENFGDSKNHLVKIDFDRCCLSGQRRKERYEQNLLSFSIYNDDKSIQDDKRYVNEKLYARLKLSMLTESLLSHLADKAFMEEDGMLRDQSIAECLRRSEIALELFKEHNQSRNFLTENPNVLDDCYNEISNYVDKHFEQNQKQEILTSLNDRFNVLKEDLNKFSNNQPSEEIKKTPQNLQTTYYEYQIQEHEKGRFHAFKLKGSDFEKLSKHFQFLSGDYLKSSILEELKNELNEINSINELKDFIKKEDQRIDVLKKGQGIATRMFNISTSSFNAFNKMVEERSLLIRGIEEKESVHQTVSPPQ